MYKKFFEYIGLLAVMLSLLSLLLFVPVFYLCSNDIGFKSLIITLISGYTGYMLVGYGAYNTFNPVKTLIHIIDND